MSLSPGSQLGPYEIEALLGEGGPAFAREASFGASAAAQARIWS